MQTLLPAAEAVAALLREREETVAVSESSGGGMIAAALLAVPGASAYFRGGAVVYTAKARAVLLDVPREAIAGMRSASEPYARLCARSVRARLGATWGLAETGASGPDGNAYGDPPGHTCVAVAGPARGGGGASEVVETSRTIETGDADRLGNMRAFAAAALALLAARLRE